MHIFAPAKVNLALHVTGQRADGYHELDSAVVLLNCGDDIHISAHDGFKLTADGPFGSMVPLDRSNLIAKAVDLMAQYHSKSPDVHIHLTKKLPPSSGIGGGSSDAAATLVGLAEFWGCDLPPVDHMTRLGADVPVCLQRGTVRMRGIGQQIDPLDWAWAGWYLLVNPGVGVSTPDVFRRLPNKSNPPLSVNKQITTDPIGWLRDQRNDLQPPAVDIAPVIQDVLDTLSRQDGVELVRMSGSGATCFALFDDYDACQHAARNIVSDQPKWWVAMAQTCCE
mgnify:CR=1 FL=1